MGLTGIAAGVFGAGALGAGANIFGSLSASSKQQAAANQAIAYMQANLGNTAQNLQPFISGGQGAYNNLLSLTGNNPGGNPMTAPLTAPFASSPFGQQAALAQTPGYQFTLGQGEKAVQNSASAQGLGKSGSALAGGINYAEGLAGTTYQQQFGNYLAQNQQIYNMLGGLASSGQNAATQLGSIGAGISANTGQAAIGAGNAQAAGILGATSAGSNALTSGANSAANLYTLSSLYPQLGSLFGSNAGGAGAGVVDSGAWTTPPVT
jgi:hypothetical protein